MATYQPQPDLTQSYRPSLYAAAIITYSLAVGAVVLRFTARRLTHLHLWYDDWLVVVALLAVTGFFIDSFVWIRLGLGLHYQAIKASYDTILRNTFLNLFIEELFYSTGTAFMKLSLLAFYWRIFNVPSIRRPIIILVAAVGAWLFARYIATILHCIPVPAYWDKSITNASCGVNDRLFFMGTNTVNFVLDLIVLVLPMPYVQKLQVRRSQKLVVFSMFALGGFLYHPPGRLLQARQQLTGCYMDDFSNRAMGGHRDQPRRCHCVPTILRPIFLLVTKGSAQPGAAHGSRKLNNSSSLKSKAMATFGSKGRNAKAFAGMDAEDEHYPFSIIHDDKNAADTGYNAGGSANHGSNMHLEELQPPQDRVMVREDIYVKYSDV